MADKEIVGWLPSTSEFEAIQSGDTGLIEGSLDIDEDLEIGGDLALGGELIVAGSSMNARINPKAFSQGIAMTAGAGTGIVVADGVEVDDGVNDFLKARTYILETTRPPSDIVLSKKHDGTTGYILILRTTGVIRLTLNGLHFDSTVALAEGTNVSINISPKVVRETTSSAGSASFYVNGVILGSAVTIAAHDDTELVTNGSFATDTDWTKGAGWTIAAGVATATAALHGSSLDQSVGFVAGYTYTLTFDITGYSAGSLTIYAAAELGGGATLVGTSVISGDGSYALTFTVINTGNLIVLQSMGIPDAATYNIDNVSIRKSNSISNSASQYELGTSSAITGGIVSEVADINFAPTDSQILDWYTNGLPAAWQYGSNVPVYESDFSATAGGFTGNAGAVAGNIDGIGAENDWLRFTVDATLDSHFARLASILAANTLYRVYFLYYIPSGQAYINGVGFNYNSGGTSAGIGNTTGSVAAFSAEFESGGSASDLRFYAYDDNSTVFQDPSGTEVFYIKDIIIAKLGATVHLPPEGIDASLQWKGAANKVHAMLPVAGATPTRMVKEFEIRWTNTWNGTHELQYIGGLNQSILPANAYIESIVGTVSGATPHDIIVGDGSDTDRYVALTTALAAETQSFTLVNRTTDGTNLKLTVDPDTNATMSIAWVIRGYTLET